MEEQDIQIRGFNIRFPLDVLMVFSANPEDYTNRGNIITPLKDRIDSQIITHYPKTLEIGVEITKQEAWEKRASEDGQQIVVHIPHYFREIVEQIAFEARASEYVDQKSGVSARMTRAAIEDLISAAERRALLHDENETTVRISDLLFIEPAITGKIELVYEGEQEGAQNVARLLVGRAVNAIFKRYFPDPSDKKEGRSPYQSILSWFARGNSIQISPNASHSEYVRTLDSVEGLHDLVKKQSNPGNPDETASAMGFVLEALHQNSLVGKEYVDDVLAYNDMMGSMLSSLGSISDDDDDVDGDEDDFYSRYG
jgi:magnesium chelatase subunit I